MDPAIKELSAYQYLLLLCGVSSLMVGGSLYLFHKYIHEDSVKLELALRLLLTLC